jgi:CBS domain-containing protein/sporulation protein YlmC with PRC-barrel domain
MLFFSEVFFSRLINKPVLTQAGVKIGKIKDVAVKIGDNFPLVVSFFIRSHNPLEKDFFVNSDSITLVNKQFAISKHPPEKILLDQPVQNEMLLNRDVLDKQIVDINGSKIVRVNDLKLSQINGEIRLVAVDIGLIAILRRLMLGNFFLSFGEFFGIKWKPNLISWSFVEPLRTDMEKLKLTVPYQKISQLHPSDIAEIVSHVHQDEKTAIFSSLQPEIAAEALHELEPEQQMYIVGDLKSDTASDILEKMPPDEAADILGDLSPEKTSELIQLMEVKEVKEVSKLLFHHDQTAGGLMTTEFISIPKNFSAQQTIEHLRKIAPEAETIYYLYVVDEENRIGGVISLRDLIIAPPEKHISEIMIKKVISVKADLHQKEVASLISKYNLLALPVVDDEKKLLGIVTVDDIVDIVIPPRSRKKRLRMG